MAVTIAYSVARQLVDDAARQAPAEACGLLAGTNNHIAAAHPLRNIAAAPETQFRADPEEQLQALKAIDAAGRNWLGVYHSHPTSAPIPSPQDIDQCADGGLLQLIVSLEGAQPELKLWRVDQASVAPVDLVYDTVHDHDSQRRFTKSQQAAVIAVGIAAVLIMLLVSLSLLPPAPEILPSP
ncbi:MAG: M67 family metallopeptidase [Chloroflexi bacterium]|nr:M67 family metallopeptidase [Chloroflexota bacterium]